MKRSQELVGSFAQQRDARDLNSPSLPGERDSRAGDGEITQLATALAQIQRLLPGKPPSAQPTTEFDTDLIADYLAGTLDDKAKEEAEALLANNPAARHYLVELRRNEKRLANDELYGQHEEISEQDAAKIADNFLASRREAEPPGPTADSRAFLVLAVLQNLAALVATRRLWQFAVLALGAIALCAILLRPIFDQWYSDKLAIAGMQALVDDRTLPEYAVRLGGDFLPAPGGFYRSQSDQAQASRSSREFAASLSWNAENVVALRGQALIAYFNFEYEEALAILHKLLQDSPQDALLLNDLGVVAAALEQPEQALSYFEQAVTYQPDFVIARFNRAVMLEELGRIEPAIRAWQEYLALSENTPWLEVAHDRLQKLQRDTTPR